MQPISPVASIPTAIYRPLDLKQKKELIKCQRTTVQELCEKLNIPYVITRSQAETPIFLSRECLSCFQTTRVGFELITHIKFHCQLEGQEREAYGVCLPLLEKTNPNTVLETARILETIAFGFMDYSARECVCFKGYFSNFDDK